VDGTGMNSEPLAGKVALVTGASSGIGRACALALADAGAAVALGFSANRRGADEVAALIRGGGGRAAPLGADLADPAAAATVVDGTIRELGAIDIVVNNAGITRDNLAVRITDDDWEAVIAVDLSAAFRICRAALRPMLRRRDGRIINISSVAGVTGNPGQANYSAAKAGLIGLTKSLCREVGSRRITVNAVAPGFIATDMTAAMGADTLATAAAAVPLRRLGTADEVAAAVRFLALPEAAYITGHVLHVDGGLAA
jgi:3-oxoacyl-[acyl-carrier protein] reductase